MSVEFLSKVKVELVKHNAADEDVAYAAWVSNYADRNKNQKPSSWNEEGLRAWNKKTTGLLNFLYRNKHMSPFEHGSFTFFIEAPIFVAREFMRHRTFSFNEMSGRYTELQPHFYLPSPQRPLVQQGKVGAYTFTEGSEEQYGRMIARQSVAYQKAWDSYQGDLNDGIAKEVARNVLGVGIYTKFYATANPRNVMQFLTLRDEPTALQEIQWVAREMDKHFAKAMPVTHQAYSDSRRVWDKFNKAVDLRSVSEVESMLDKILDAA